MRGSRKNGNFCKGPVKLCYRPVGEANLASTLDDSKQWQVGLTVVFQPIFGMIFKGMINSIVITGFLTSFFSQLQVKLIPAPGAYILSTKKGNFTSWMDKCNPARMTHRLELSIKCVAPNLLSR